MIRPEARFVVKNQSARTTEQKQISATNFDFTVGIIGISCLKVNTQRDNRAAQVHL